MNKREFEREAMSYKIREVMSYSMDGFDSDEVEGKPESTIFSQEDIEFLASLGISA